MYKAEPGATRIDHEDASAGTAHARQVTAPDLLDQRAESATQRRLLALANGSPRQMRLAAAGTAPIQRRIDDEQQRALVPELVRR